MNRIIAGFIVGVLLLPMGAQAQSYEQTPEYQALIYQLIAVLTQQIELLQAQIVEMKAAEAKLMADEPVEAVEESQYQIEEDGTMFGVKATVPLAPQRITVTLDGDELPTSLTLRAGLTLKGAEFTETMKKNGNKYSIDLSDRFDGEDFTFKGNYEILFPEDFNSLDTDFEVEYKDEGTTLTATLHKDASNSN